MIETATSWLPHDGLWSLEINGHRAIPGTIVYPDQKKYVLRIMTMCGKEDVTIEAVPLVIEPMEIFARRAQIAGSIGHVTRRACHECLRAYRQRLTPFEKQFLYQTEPKLGPVLGISGMDV